MFSQPTETIEFNQTNRQARLQQLQQSTWDVLVIGGGINGAGVALEAAYRGLSVAVLDQADFSFGTSSRSTKLAHGGFRYLAQREFGLVREATTERNWLRKRALPHLARPTRFLYPILEAKKTDNEDLPKSWSYRSVRLGSFLYDLLTGFKSYKKSKGIKKVEKIKELEPLLDSSRLKSAVSWYDSNIDDARLVIETLKEAQWKGKALSMNYLRVIGFIENAEGRIGGVEVIDMNEPTSKRFRVRGKVIINTTGVWADELLSLRYERADKILRPTKGVHLIYHQKDFPINNTFAMNSITDGRFFFAIRRNNWVLVGTTDTDYSGDPAECFCTREDADYLRKTIQVLFPNAQIDDKRIQGTYAGLRPLVTETEKAESEISRKHTIIEHEEGLYSLLGGKLTTFRKMAEDLFLNHIRKSHQRFGLVKFSGKKNLTKITYHITLHKREWEALPEVLDSSLPELIKSHLYQQYGRGSVTILRAIKDDPSQASRLLDDPAYPIEVAPWIIGEVDYVVKHEAPLHLADVLCRRMEVCWLIRPEYQGRIAVIAAKRMGQILGWSRRTAQKEIDDYLGYVCKNSFFFDGEIPKASL
ncbi:MAG: FAD-dependent oxidoreductase [Candidatus Thorarchaeota archaeon]